MSNSRIWCIWYASTFALMQVLRTIFEPAGPLSLDEIIRMVAISGTVGCMGVAVRGDRRHA